MTPGRCAGAGILLRRSWHRATIALVQLLVWGSLIRLGSPGWHRGAVAKLDTAVRRRPLGPSMFLMQVVVLLPLELLIVLSGVERGHLLEAGEDMDGGLWQE